MTEACFLIHNVGLNKPKTCEECYCNATCKMYANFKELEKVKKAYNL